LELCALFVFFNCYLFLGPLDTPKFVLFWSRVKCTLIRNIQSENSWAK
jgi:hypothetical protein